MKFLKHKLKLWISKPYIIQKHKEEILEIVSNLRTLKDMLMKVTER